MTNPRLHKHVRKVDGNRLRYVCGCVNEISDPHGVLHSLWKCDNHKAECRDPVTLGHDYFVENGVLDKDGNLLSVHYLQEMLEALGPFPVGPAFEVLGMSQKLCALEIGGGISPYAEAIIDSNWNYIGVDPCQYAASVMKSLFGVAVFEGRLEDYKYHGIAKFVLAAHSLEHMVDAPGEIKRIFDLTQGDGQFWLIIPDDTDPLNPEHLWFFDETTLSRCLEAAGFVIEKMVVRKRIERENFIYCIARKP